MVPLADMLNTGWEFNTRWSYSQSRDGFVVEATKDISSGEELLDTYGHKTNAEYFMNYAFILLDKEGHNNKDEYPFKVYLDPEDPQVEIKLDIFLPHVLDPKFAEFRIRHDFESTEDFQNMLSWVRFVTYDGDLMKLYERTYEKREQLAKEVKDGDSDEDGVKFFAKPFSMYEEVRAWISIRSILEAHL